MVWRYVSNIHKYIGFIIFSLCLAVWWRACTVDPGTIYPETVEQWGKVWQAGRLVPQWLS